MATSLDFIEYACDQIRGVGVIRYRKMFGEYMIYINDKPILLVCDDTVFVKMLEEVETLMQEAETGKPYESAKEHYILDIDDQVLSRKIVSILEPITPIPKPKKPKNKKT